MNQESKTPPSDKSSCCEPACCSPNPAPAPLESTGEALRDQVRDKYGKAVEEVLHGAQPGCCGSKAVSVPGVDPITRDLYTLEDEALVPRDAVLASFGCGNPTALAELTPGEIVLDLGSGGGIDVLLSARRVAPNGKAYGLDMTPQMLDLARKNQRTAGVENAEFLAGHIESIPLPNSAVDVVISNCVINLSSDKDKVLHETFRVLKPGGRLAVSDIVLRRALPTEARRSLELWAGCVAGALLEEEYKAKLEAAGFTDISITPTRVYTQDDAQEIVGAMTCCGNGADDILKAIDGAAMSAFVRAKKPSEQ